MTLTIRKASDFYAKIRLTSSDGAPVLLSDGDELVFGVKKSLVRESPVVIRKTLHDYDQMDGSYPFTLTADETDIPCGEYFYDIALQCANGEFYHVTPADSFIVKETVARKESEQ